MYPTWITDITWRYEVRVRLIVATPRFSSEMANWDLQKGTPGVAEDDMRLITRAIAYGCVRNQVSIAHRSNLQFTENLEQI